MIFEFCYIHVCIIHEAQTFVDDISHEIETMKQFMDSKDFNIQYTMLNATSRIAIFYVNLFVNLFLSEIED